MSLATNTTRRKCSSINLILTLFGTLLTISLSSFYYEGFQSTASLFRPTTTPIPSLVLIPSTPPATIIDPIPQPQSTSTEPSPIITVDGINLQYTNPPPATTFHSTVHCMGETFTRDAWQHRSCRFQNMCFDLKNRDFVLFRAEAGGEREMSKALKEKVLANSASSMDTSVSIGGINPRWTFPRSGTGGAYRLEWFPRIIDTSLTTGYYKLSDPHTVLVPFHSMAAINVGHLVWDDLLPIYTLLSMFGFIEEDYKIILFRYLLSDSTDNPLWGSCEKVSPYDNVKKCNDNFVKFLPLFGQPPLPPPNTLHSWTYESMKAALGKEPESQYVCAERSVVGIGLLTDHGLKLHGWEEKDYQHSHNQGKGKLLWDFRSFMIKKLGLTSPLLPPPYKITFSLDSSGSFRRRLQFKQQIAAVTELFKDRDDVIVQSFIFSTLSIEEQINITMSTSIYITSAGGGAVTAMFLPKSSALVIFFDDIGDNGVGSRNKKKLFPSRLDWDYFNNAAYLRVSWLPIITMEAEIKLFENVIRSEMEAVRHLS